MRTLKFAESLPLTRELLAQGGDARIRLEGGRNEYGCMPYPDPALIQFGSSTASTLSEQAFEAADALRESVVDIADEFERIRQEFLSLCGLSNIGGLKLHFCPSGTDAHQLAFSLTKPRHIVMVSGSETGRGVPAALSGGRVHQLQIRNPEGVPRDGFEIDEEAARLVESFAKEKVLLVLVDVSKTGLIAPSFSCAREMKRRFPHSVEVLVDASQFRIGTPTLSAYLDEGFLLAVTGSKFLTGPTFSGALLVPGSFGAIRPKDPENNLGLLLRWEAALAELRAFRSIPGARVESFLSRFAGGILDRLGEDPRFEPLSVPELDRTHSGWDKVQTIFPFRMKRKSGFVGLEEARRIHALLREDLSPVSGHETAALRFSLGQPVSCGALRLCSSARLALEGVENESGVIDRALFALDKTAWLLDHSG